ncbi:MAG: hypothetical protein EAZ35_09760 [Sphingobacteriia bacterium]|nr:MAG: hypothetical protein EAZ41_10160 [Sphingobacteriia bacterium]TAG29749.1 MAG: hypothetical protein EAZ35_09760 [Sphingobacteriia bacterium]
MKLQKKNESPKNALGENQLFWLEELHRALQVGNFSKLDNNPVENSIRPVAVGRKKYLFAGSHAATHRLAVFYSLLATCKNYNLNPTKCMHDILTRIAGYPD